MVRLDSLLSYKKAEHEDLDKKWEQVRTIHVFKGLGFSEALTDKEYPDKDQANKKVTTMETHFPRRINLGQAL